MLVQLENEYSKFQSPEDASVINLGDFPETREWKKVGSTRNPTTNSAFL